MKKINNFILEKLKISKTSFMLEKLKINSKSKICGYGVDRLNDIKTVLYSDIDNEKKDEDDVAVEYNDFIDTIENIDGEYPGFIVSRYNSLEKIKGKDNKVFIKTVNDYSNNLSEIKDRIITGKDLGYEVRLAYGHLEFDCINSGSRATYYVYALSHEAYSWVELWFEGDEGFQDLNFLYEEGNIIPIEI